MHESEKGHPLETPSGCYKEGELGIRAEQRFRERIIQIERDVTAANRGVEASGVNSRELLRTGAGAKTAGNQDLRNRFGI